MSSDYQIPTHVPRPLAQSMVKDFTKKIHAQGYTNVHVELPLLGDLKIEIKVLKRDEAVLRIINKALIEHIQTFKSEEETKDSMKPDDSPSLKPESKKFKPNK